MLQSGLQQKARSEGGRPPTHYAPPQVGSAQEEEAVDLVCANQEQEWLDGLLSRKAQRTTSAMREILVVDGTEQRSRERHRWLNGRDIGVGADDHQLVTCVCERVSELWGQRVCSAQKLAFVGQGQRRGR